MRRAAYITPLCDGRWAVLCFDKSGMPVANPDGRAILVYSRVQTALAVASIWLDYGFN